MSCAEEMRELREARKLLGATRTTSLEALKRSYRKLALKTHPDKEGGSAELFQDCANAYELCKAYAGKSVADAERAFAQADRKTEYYRPPADRTPKQPSRPFARNGSVNPFDVFSDAFRGAGEASSRATEVKVTFEWGVDGLFWGRERSFYDSVFGVEGAVLTEADDRQLEALRSMLRQKASERGPAIAAVSMRTFMALMNGTLDAAAFAHRLSFPESGPSLDVLVIDARSPEEVVHNGAFDVTRCRAKVRCVALPADACADSSGEPFLRYGCHDAAVAPDHAMLELTLGPDVARTLKEIQGAAAAGARILVVSQTGTKVGKRPKSPCAVVAECVRESRVLPTPGVSPKRLEGGFAAWSLHSAVVVDDAQTVSYRVAKGGCIVRAKPSLESTLVAELFAGDVVKVHVDDVRARVYDGPKERLRIRLPFRGYVTASRLQGYGATAHVTKTFNFGHDSSHPPSPPRRPKHASKFADVPHSKRGAPGEPNAVLEPLRDKDLSPSKVDLAQGSFASFLQARAVPD